MARKRTYTKVDEARVLKLVGMKWSERQISAKLGIPKSSVHRIKTGQR